MNTVFSSAHSVSLAFRTEVKTLLSELNKEILENYRGYRSLLFCVVKKMPSLKMALHSLTKNG